MTSEITLWKKIYTTLIGAVMLGTILTTMVYAQFSMEKVDYDSEDFSRVSIDLGFKDDRSSMYKYISKSNNHLVRLDDDLYNNKQSMEIFSDSHRLIRESIEYTYERNVGKMEKVNNQINGNYIMKENPINSNKIAYSNNNDIIYDYAITPSGVKETITINSFDRNISSDLIINNIIKFDRRNLNIYDSSGKLPFGEIVDIDGDIYFRDRNEEIIFTIPQPVLWTSYMTVVSNDGPLQIRESSEIVDISHRVNISGNKIQYEMIIPNQVLLDENLPLVIDPSITSHSGYTKYKGYDDGTVAIITDSTTTYYNNADKNVYVDSDIDVGLGEVLIFENVNLLFNDTNIKVSVGYGARLNIVSNSTVSTSNENYRYSICYQNGSSGSVLNSIIEKVNSTNGFEICSSNINVEDSTFRKCEPYGIFINQSSPDIINCNFYDLNTALYVSPYSNPNIVDNRINDTTTGIIWRSANIFDNLDTVDNVEKMVGVKHENGGITYKNLPFNTAPSCPNVTVDSTYSSSYEKEKMYDGITAPVWYNQWSSTWNEPHWAIFNFEETINISHFKIYHREDHPTYDYKIQSWSGSSWDDEFDINSNTDSITYHNLSNTISTERIRLYITDSNYNFDNMARIREFEIYNEDNSSSHYFLSKQISTFGDTIYGNLLINKSEPGSSNIVVSVLDPITNSTITGYSKMSATNIDLSGIDVIKYPSIIIKYEFLTDGEVDPYLYEWSLSFLPYNGKNIEMIESNEIFSEENIRYISGKLELDITSDPQNINYEYWDDNWDDNWTINEKYDGADYEIVENHWEGSGNDLFVEATSNTPSSGHDGYIIVNRFFGKIDPEWILKTHFEGKINYNIYNYADILLTLYDETNSSKRTIRWTTRDYSYNSGLNGDTYYYVAQDNQTSPYQYDEYIDNSFKDLYEGCFGDSGIDWTEHLYFDYKILVIENYNQRQDPKVYVDYIEIIDSYENSGYCIFTPFIKQPDTSWAYLIINGTWMSESDVEVTLLTQSENEKIPNFLNVTDKYIDIGPLNNLNIDSFILNISLEKNMNKTPSIEFVKVLKSSKFQYNYVIDNEVGIECYDSSSLITQNVIRNNEKGIILRENRSTGRYDDQMSFLLSGNHFQQNSIALIIENSSALISSNFFENNDRLIISRNSSVDIYENRIEYNHNNLIINDSYVIFDNNDHYQNYFNISVSSSEILIDSWDISSDVDNHFNITNSTIGLIDTYYEDMNFQINDQASKINCMWSYLLQLLDTTGDPKSNEQVRIYRNDGVQIVNKDTDSSGILDGVLIKEREYNYQGQELFNPFNIKFNSCNFAEELNSIILHPYKETIYANGDYDSDQLPNKYEDEVLSLSPQDLVVNKSHLLYMNTGDALSNENLQVTNKSLFYSDNEKHYRAFVIMNSTKNQYNVSLYIFNNETNVLTQSFRIGDTVRGWNSDPFTLSNGTCNITISIDDDSINNNEIFLHKIILFENQSNYNSAVSDPLDPDIDMDGCMDGMEYNENTYFIEAERFPLSLNQIIKNPEAGNRTTLLNLGNGSVMNKSFSVPLSKYQILVKVKNNDTTPTNITIWINNSNYIFSITSNWTWLEIPTLYGEMFNINISTELGSLIQVDKILLNNIFDNGENQESLMEMNSVQNTIPDMDRVVLNEKWKNRIKHSITSKPAVTSDHIYYSSTDKYIVKIDRINGDLLLENDIASSYDPFNDFDFASTPIIDGINGVCFFEKDGYGQGFNYIVGFNTSSLTANWAISYSYPNSLQDTGIIFTNNQIFYTIKNSGLGFCQIVSRNFFNGNLIWMRNVTSTYLTRATIPGDTLYVGATNNMLYKITNFLTTNPTLTPQPLSQQFQFDLRSVLLEYQNFLYTITYDGFIVRIDPASGNLIVSEENFGSNIVDSKLLLSYPYIYFGNGNGYIYRMKINVMMDMFEHEVEYYYDSYLIQDEISYIYKCDNDIIVSSEYYLYVIDNTSMDIKSKLLLSFSIAGITICGSNIYYSHKNNGLSYAIGKMISDISDFDLDSDGAKDGNEISGYHNQYLIENEDYYNSHSTMYNISTVTLFALDDDYSNFEIGMSNPDDYSNVNYTVMIPENDTYSFSLQIEPNAFFHSGETDGDSAFMVSSKEYVLEALSKAFIISMNGSAFNTKKSFWGSGRLLDGSILSEVEGEGYTGGGIIIIEYCFYLQAGIYSLDIDIDLYDSSNSLYYIDLGPGTDSYKLVGMNVTLDNCFIRRDNISIFDSDCDDDYISDGYEISNDLFPLNSDPDMDGISDYYEVFGIDRDFSFDYNGTHPFHRDSDFDGIRDRIELGLNSNDNDIFTEYDSIDALASAYERSVRGLSPGQSLTNNDRDNTSVTDPNDADTDNDGLPDGCIDGLFFEPIYSVNGELGPLGRDCWYISTSHLNRKIEFWEGEDLNVDGFVDGGQWNFGPDNKTHFGGETNPLSNDTDSDDLPDGWEVWHTINPCDDTSNNGRDGDLDYEYSYRYPWEFCTLNIQDSTCDGLSNWEEFMIGTNPIINDTDQDGASDGYEISDEGVYQFFIYTNIENASVSCDNYGETNQHIQFDYYYQYDRTIYLDGKSHDLKYPINLSSESVNNVFLTFLYDGTKIMKNTSSYEIYVLKPLSKLEDRNSDGIPELEYVVYEFTIETFTHVMIRYQNVFISDPLVTDSDYDGLTDKEEDWTHYGMFPDYWDDKDNDGFPNHRDVDSDNDGLKDGEEYRYYWKFDSDFDDSERTWNNDTDCDGIPSVLDQDSDGDTLTDGIEHIVNDQFMGARDIDGDGYPSMLDIDSDGDGIPDGWIDGYRYDPTCTFRNGSSYYIELPKNGLIDQCEGEDLNDSISSGTGDGLIDGDTNNNRIIDDGETFNESDPYYIDTDRDGLIDGYSPSYIPIIRMVAQRYYSNVQMIGEWESSEYGWDSNCVNTDNDTDDDSLLDGIEVKGWSLKITTIDDIEESRWVSSDPTLENTDNDDLDDDEEFTKFDPKTSDTDGDGLSDYYETTHAGLDPYNQDSDSDYLPDGYIDYNENQEINDTERDLYPTNPDNDNDGLIDGMEISYLLFRTNCSNGEYYIGGSWIFLDPGIGEYTGFWYYENVTNANLSNVTQLPFNTYDDYSIYANLTLNSSTDEPSIYAANNVNYVLIKNGNTYYKFLPSNIYFDEISWNGDQGDFNRLYSTLFDLEYRSVEYYSKEVHASLSDPSDNDTDGDGLLDGLEYYNLSNKNVMRLFTDFDSDGLYTLRDNDSDGDQIEDLKDLYRENSEGIWEEYYFGDYDGDGKPCALDNDSDNDNKNDGDEDTDHNGKYNRFIDDSDPLDSDDDDDGIMDAIESSYGLSSSNPDCDGDGIIDGLDGPNGNWKSDCDGDGVISALDNDSDGDGLLENYSTSSSSIREKDQYDNFYNTDPWNPDTDDDLLWDGYNITLNSRYDFLAFCFIYGRGYKRTFENSNGNIVMVGELAIGTNHLNDDSDGDNITDGKEVYGFFECGIVINKFEDKFGFNQEGDILQIPIPLPGEYVIGFKNRATIGNTDIGILNKNKYEIDTVWIDNYNHKVGFSYIGEIDEITDYFVEIKDNHLETDLNIYLLRKGLDPLSNDTDADYILDGEEIYGEYDRYTHPNASDSDGDGLQDYEELSYYHISRDNLDYIQLNPLDPDYDSDGIPDGSDYQPTERYDSRWSNYVYAYTMNWTTTYEFVYAVSRSDRSYDTKGVERGKLTQESITNWVKDLNQQYLYTNFGEISKPKWEDNYTYEINSYTWIKYGIKSQQIEATYTNLRRYKDDSIHTRQRFGLRYDTDNEITILVTIDGDIFDNLDANDTIKLMGNYQVYNEYHDHGGIAFEAHDIYNGMFALNHVSTQYPYYKDRRTYEIKMLVPKEIVQMGNRVENYSSIRELAFDISILATKVGDDNISTAIDLTDKLEIGSIIKEKSNMSYSLLTKPGYPLIKMEKVIYENINDLSTIKSGPYEFYNKSSDESYTIKFINYINADENQIELNNKLLHSSRYGTSNEVAIVIIGPYRSYVEDIISENEWSSVWSINSSAEENPMGPLDQLMVNSKICTVASPEWSSTSKGDKLKAIISGTASATEKISGKFQQKVQYSNNVQLQSFNFRLSYSHKKGSSLGALSISNSELKYETFDSSGYQNYQVSVKKSNYILYINKDNIDIELDYENVEIEQTLVKVGGIHKLCRVLNVAGSGVGLAVDFYTLLCDGKNLITAYYNETNNAYVLSAMTIKYGIEVVQFFNDVKEFGSAIKNIKNIKAVTSKVSKIPVVAIFVVVVVLILELIILTDAWNKAKTWIQANMIEDMKYEAVVEAAIDIIMLIVACFWPVGTVIAIVYAVVRTILAITGWEDDVKEFLHNLFGHATAQQSQEAYEGVCEKIDYIVNTKIIQNRKDKKNIIFIGLYPDVSK